MSFIFCSVFPYQRVYLYIAEGWEATGYVTFQFHRAIEKMHILRAWSKPSFQYTLRIYEGVLEKVKTHTSFHKLRPAWISLVWSWIKVSCYQLLSQINENPCWKITASKIWYIYISHIYDIMYVYLYTHMHILMLFRISFQKTLLLKIT